MASAAKMDVPENANSGCVGTGSEMAGKADGCAGCPNQSACASGKLKAPDATGRAVADQLSAVKHTIVVLSGKGGVGKSTFSAQLAFTLAASGKQVGLLDVDICGPSIPRMLGLVGREVHQSGSGWSPVWLDSNLGVMSIGFMLPDTDDAVVWRGPRKDGLIRNFLKDVVWGDLDYLIIDTPPGTSDEHISIVQYLKQVNVDGAVIVTTPQEVSMADVRKELNFCKKVKMPVLGVVENMAGFVCPCCKTKTDIFKAASGATPAAMAEKFGVPFLGSVPLDPAMMASCESGEPFCTKHPDSPAAKPFMGIVDAVVAATPDVTPEEDASTTATAAPATPAAGAKTS